MNPDNFSPEDLNTLALAMDYLLCNANLPPDAMREVEELFYYLDAIAEVAEEAAEDQRLLEKTDNLLVVDFRPKSD